MRPFRCLARPFLRTAVVLTLFGGWNSALFGDLNTYRIKTVEWLVDNSDVIAIVRDSVDAAAARPDVLATLKGNADRIKWPLANPPQIDSRGYQISAPSPAGMSDWSL